MVFKGRAYTITPDGHRLDGIYVGRKTRVIVPPEHRAIVSGSKVYDHFSGDISDNHEFVMSCKDPEIHQKLYYFAGFTPNIIRGHSVRKVHPRLYVVEHTSTNMPAFDYRDACGEYHRL
jgi:hypothetical protein